MVESRAFDEDFADSGWWNGWPVRPGKNQTGLTKTPTHATPHGDHNRDSEKARTPILALIIFFGERFYDVGRVYSYRSRVAAAVS